MKCLNCGSDMMFLKVAETDTIYIVEKCDCQEVVNVEFLGTIKNI